MKKRDSINSSNSPRKIAVKAKNAQIYQIDLNQNFGEIEFKTIENVSPLTLSNKSPINYQDFSSASKTRDLNGPRRIERVNTVYVSKHTDSIISTGHQTKDQDLFKDLIKSGYSQKLKMDSSVRSLKDPNQRRIQKGDRNKITPFKSPNKDMKDANLKTKLSRNNSVEKNEVNRIFSVLQKNLMSPQSYRLGVQQTTPENDPKREKVRKLLQKHFQLKEQELHQSYDTLNLANDTIIIKAQEYGNSCGVEGMSGFLKKLEESEVKANDNFGPYYQQPSCGETMHFGPDKDYSKYFYFKI
jgi:hypothetical protein